MLRPSSCARRAPRRRSITRTPSRCSTSARPTAQLFIAMELVVGKSLRAFVGDASVPWDTKLRWMVDAARALGAAHERGLVHRDVKPENVMVRADGVVKVLDFGIAKRVQVDVAGRRDARRPEARSRCSAGIVGTPWYLSPEQIRGEAVDGRADQFAWGVATYELLTGRAAVAQGRRRLPARAGHPEQGARSRRRSAAGAAVDRRRDDHEDAGEVARRSASTRWRTSSTALEGHRVPVAAQLGERAGGGDEQDGPRAPARCRLLRPSLGGAPERTDGATTLPSRPVPPAPHEAAPPGRRGRRSDGGRGGDRAGVGTPRARGEPAPAPATGRVDAHRRRRRRRSPLTCGLPRRACPRPSRRTARSSRASATPTGAPRDAALEDAVARDPTMAAAQLRLALHAVAAVDRRGARARDFMLAERNRASLDERDAALLDALEPYLQGDPSDPVESERRLEAMHARWPLDAEIAYVLGSVRFDRGDFADALEGIDAAIAIDPAFAQAWSTKGGVLAYLGRLDDARTTLDEARRQSRTATEPLWYSAEIAEQQGRCADEEATTREWLSRDPADWFAYQYLASSLAAEGKPLDTGAHRAGAEVGARSRRRAGEAPADRARRARRARRGLRLGAGASRRAGEGPRLGARRAGARRVAGSSAAHRRGERAERPRARGGDLVPRAQGRVGAAAPRGRGLHLPRPRAGDARRARARGRDRRRAARRAERADWLAAWRAKTSAAYLGVPLDRGVGGLREHARQAEAALRAQPEFGRAPAVRADVLRGRPRRPRLLPRRPRPTTQIAALRRGVATCTMLGEGLRTTRAPSSSGGPRERGRHGGSVRAYGVVLARWGHAKPRSVTADDARARLGTRPSAATRKGDRERAGNFPTIRSRAPRLLARFVSLAVARRLPGGPARAAGHGERRRGQAVVDASRGAAARVPARDDRGRGRVLPRPSSVHAHGRPQAPRAR